MTPNERGEMWKHRHLLFAVLVIRDRCSVEKHSIAVVHAQILIEDAAYDSVAGTQTIDPDGLFQARVVDDQQGTQVFCVPFRNTSTSTRT